MSSEDTRHRLLEAASVVFAERGFEGATVREICDRAGTNTAAVNYHFGDKRRLYCEAIKRAHELKRAQSPLPEWPAGTPVEVRLRDYVRQLLACMVSDASMPHHRQLILQEIARPSGAIEELVDAYIADEFARLIELLAELAPAMPEERLQMTAFSVVGQCLYYKLAMPVVTRLVGEDAADGYGVDRLSEHIAQLTLAALGCAPPVGELPLPDAGVGAGVVQ